MCACCHGNSKLVITPTFLRHASLHTTCQMDIFGLSKGVGCLGVRWGGGWLGIRRKQLMLCSDWSLGMPATLMCHPHPCSVVVTGGMCTDIDSEGARHMEVRGI